MNEEISVNLKEIQLKQVKVLKAHRMHTENKKIGGVYDAVVICNKFLKNKDREFFIVLGLNTKNDINHVSVVAVGGVDSANVNFSNVFKSLILTNSTRFIIAHNHPTNDATPSMQDEIFTKKIKKSGELLHIQLLDHLIIVDQIENTYSFRSGGMLK